MKKKLLGMLLAATLIVAQGVTAFAAGSKEAGGATVATEGYTVSESLEDIQDSLRKDGVSEEVITTVTNQINGGMSAIVDTLSKEDQKLLKGVKPLGGVFTLDPESGNDGGTVTFRVTAFPERTKKVYVLHFNKDTLKWERLDASIDKESGTVTVTFGNLSPVMLVAKTETGSHKLSEDESSTSGGSASIAAPTTAAGGLATSPRTGVSSDWMLWMGLAVSFCAVSGVMFRKIRA